MDDRTTGVTDERTAGFGDEGETPRRRTSTPSPAERTRGRSEERARGSAGIVERETTAEPRTDQIRAEIEQTREDMSETIEAIQDRLRPRNVAANAAANVRETATAAVENVRSAARDTVDEMADSRVVREVRANPVPAVMVGIGIAGAAWLAFAGRDARRERGRTEVFDHGDNFGYYEAREGHRRGRRSAGSMPETAGAYESGEGGSSVRDLASTTGEYAREAASRARHKTRRAQNQLQRAMTENPLAVGAAALAVGALIGMALPETERENELMGEARDNVVSSAQEMARTAANRVQEAAGDAARRVQDVATDVGTLVNKDQ